MFAFLSGVRRFLQLLRGVRSNALVRATAPWKQGLFPATMFVLQVAVALAFVGVMAFAGVIVFASNEFRLDLGFTRMRFDDEMFFTLAFLLFTVVAFPFNLLLYSWRWHRRGRVRDLYMTTMPQEEAAFGVYFWPIVCGAILPVAHWLGSMAFLPAMLEQYLSRRSTSFWGPDVELLLPITLAVAGLLFIPAAASVTLRLWLFRLGAKWIVLFTGPILSLVYAWAIAFVSLLFMAASEQMISGGTEVFVICAFAIVMGTVVAVHHTWSTCRLAPLMYFRVVRMDLFAEESFIGNMGLKFYDRELRGRLRKELKGQLKGSWLAAAFFLMVMGGLVLLRTFGVSVASEGSGPRGMATAIGFTAMLALCSAAALWWRHARRGELRTLSGSPFAALLRPLRPLNCAVFLAVAAAMFTGSPPDSAGEIVGVGLMSLLAAAIFVSINFLFFAGLFALPAALVRPALVLFPLALLAAWGVDALTPLRMYHTSNGIEVLYEMHDQTAALQGIAYIAMLHLATPFLQAFYKRYVRGTEPGRWAVTRFVREDASPVGEASEENS